MYHPGKYGYSDEETALQINENPYLQYFCGYAGFDGGKLPFDPPEMLGRIDEMIVRDAKEGQARESKDDGGPGDAPGQGGKATR